MEKYYKVHLKHQIIIPIQQSKQITFTFKIKFQMTIYLIKEKDSGLFFVVQSYTKKKAKDLIIDFFKCKYIEDSNSFKFRFKKIGITDFKLGNEETEKIIL